MDTDEFKKRVTYDAIMDRIKAKYGYRVTNLNIAQVKQNDCCSSNCYCS